MKPRHLWLWLFIAAGLFAVILADHRYGRRPGPAPVTVLPGLKAAAVTSIQVQPSGKVEIRAQRTNAVWQLTQPLLYPAQAVSIEKLLSLLEHLTAAACITPREMKNPARADEDYGFATRQASLILQQGDDRTIILIGARTAPGDQVFVQVVGREGVYVVDADLLQFIPRSADDWRDTALLTLQGSTVDRVCVTNGTRVVELQRDAASRLWRMVRPWSARANNTRIEDALQRLQQTRVNQFISDGPTADLEPFGLQPPQLEIALAQGTNLVGRLQLGKSPTNNAGQVYVRQPDQHSIVLVFSDLLSPWYGDINDFRDPHLVTLTAPVSAIDVHALDKFSLQQVTNDIWRVLPQDFPADAGRVKDLVAALSGMRVVQFVKDNVIEPDLTNYGLATPPWRYILKAAATNALLAPTNALIAELDFGTNTEDRIYARRTDESAVYAVKLADFQRLPLVSFQMRQRQIWNFSEDDVDRVTINQQGQVRQLKRNGPHDWSLAPGSQGSIEPIAVEETVKGLTRLAALEWVTRGQTFRPRFGFTDTGQKITLELKNGEKPTVEFGNVTRSGLAYAGVTLDGEFWIWLCPASLYRDVVGYLSIPPGTSP